MNRSDNRFQFPLKDQSKDAPKLIVIGGPTGVGKTAFSISVAQALNCPVVSADSRQFYKEMEIGTAKPSEAERKAAPHYFVDFLSIHDTYTVADYERDVLALLEELFRQHEYVILAGGSGMFIDAVCKGLDRVPGVAPHIREDLNRTLEEKGIEPLLEELLKSDPVYYEQVDKSNYRRVIRALEVCRATGQPFSAFRKKEAAPRFFKVIKNCVCLERDELYACIASRCDRMLEEGLLDEVKQLYPYRHLQPLQTIGYREFFPWLEGRISYEAAVAEFKKASRQYAKRQLTWFRRDPSIVWYSPDEANKLLQQLK